MELNTNRQLLSQRSTAGNKNAKTMTIPMQKMKNWHKVEEYQQYSQRLRSKGSPMPISELNFRRLEQTLESGHSSRYIPKLMQGNSSIRPCRNRNANIYGQTTTKVYGRAIPNSPKKFLTYLNEQSRTLTARPARMQSPHLFNSQTGDSTPNLMPGRQRIVPLTAATTQRNRREMNQSLSNSYNLKLNTTQDRSAAIYSVDMVGSIHKSARRIFRSTIDQVNDVAGQVGGVVENVGDGVMHNVGNMQTILRSTTKKAVDMAYEPVQRGVQFMLSSPKSKMHKKRPSTPNTHDESQVHSQIERRKKSGSNHDHEDHGF